MDGTKSELATVCGNKQTQPTFLLIAAHQTSFGRAAEKPPQQAGIKEEARTNPLDRCAFYDLNSILTVKSYHLKDVLAQVVFKSSQTILSLSVSQLSQHILREFPGGVVILLSGEAPKKNQLMKHIRLEITEIYLFFPST